MPDPVELLDPVSCNPSYRMNLAVPNPGNEHPSQSLQLYSGKDLFLLRQLLLEDYLQPNVVQAASKLLQLTLLKHNTIIIDVLLNHVVLLKDFYHLQLGLALAIASHLYHSRLFVLFGGLKVDQILGEWVFQSALNQVVVLPTDQF